MNSGPSIAKFADIGEKIRFRNVCGGLRFKVEKNGIKSIEFYGNNQETVAGKVEVTINNDSIPIVTRIIDPCTKVTLKSDDGFVPGNWYYISLLPVILDKGFTITLSTDEETVRYICQRTVQVKRCVFGELSQLDKGLFPASVDWTKNEFIHKSLFLSFPNRVFSGIVVSLPDATINKAITGTNGDVEIAQFFVNGTGTTSGASDLLGMFNVSTVPFFITDYRQSGSGVASARKETNNKYGTVSGIALNSYYDGNELNIETSLYFKEADDYKIVTLVTEENTSYTFTYQSGKYTSSNKSDFITRYVAGSIFGEDVSVTSSPSVQYRSQKVKVSSTNKAGKLRVLVYVLRPYGSRSVSSSGNYGSYYVDNAFSARVGEKKALPIQLILNTEISDFQNGGSI